MMKTQRLQQFLAAQPICASRTAAGNLARRAALRVVRCNSRVLGAITIPVIIIILLLPIIIAIVITNIIPIILTTILIITIIIAVIVITIGPGSMSEALSMLNYFTIVACRTGVGVNTMEAKVTALHPTFILRLL